MAKGVTVKIAHICENFIWDITYILRRSIIRKYMEKTAEYNCIMFRAKRMGYSGEQVKKAGEKSLRKIRY